MANSVTISVSEKEFSFERPKLRTWLALEDIREDIINALDRKDRISFADLVIKFLSNALPFEWDQVPWYEAIRAFHIMETCMEPNKIPILETGKKRRDKNPWEYPGRRFYELCNFLSSAYGWSIEYIGNLDIDDAMALIMEISIDNQLQKEWDWGLSDKCIEYNAKTKTSKFRSLPRPEWMLPKAEPPKKIRMLRMLVPAGNVIDLSGIIEPDTAKPS